MKRNAGIAGLVAAITAMTAALGAFLAPAAGTVQDTRPNIVLITTDDMTDYELSHTSRLAVPLRDATVDRQTFLQREIRG